MSLALSARFARRELRGGLRDFRIFLACLALGVAAIAAVGTVRAAIEGGLEREGAALLGGDAEMEFTYRFATPEERAWMEDTATQARSSGVAPGWRTPPPACLRSPISDPWPWSTATAPPSAG